MGGRAGAGDHDGERGSRAPAPLHARPAARLLRPRRPAAPGAPHGDTGPGKAVGRLQRPRVERAGRRRQRVGRGRHRLLPVPVPPDGGCHRPCPGAGRAAPGRARRACALPARVPRHLRRRRRLLLPHGGGAPPRRADVPGGGAPPDSARAWGRGAPGYGPARWRADGPRRPALHRERGTGGRAQGLQDAGLVLRHVQGASPGTAGPGPRGPHLGGAAAPPRHRGDGPRRRGRQMGHRARLPRRRLPVGPRILLPGRARGLGGPGAGLGQRCLRAHPRAFRTLGGRAVVPVLPRVRGRPRAVDG